MTVFVRRRVIQPASRPANASIAEGVGSKSKKIIATNRAEHKVRSTKTPGHNDRPRDYGVDYVELAFGIREPGDIKSTRYVTWKPRGYDTPDGPVVSWGWLEIIYKAHTIRLKAYRSESLGWRGFLHFNPARIVDPAGIGLCRPRDLYDVIEEVMGVVSQHVRPLGPSVSFSVRRIDVARNFSGVVSPTNYLTGLFGVYRPHAKSTSLIKGRDGQIGTLRSGSGSGGWVSLYDKHLEAPHVAPPGTMRFEIQARRSWCQRFGGIYTVSDLTPFNLDKLTRNRIRWFGLERDVMTSNTACEKILLNRDLEKREQDGLIRYVLETRLGIKPTASVSSVRKYRALIGNLNIAPSVDLTTETDLIAHLDFKSGTEVQVAQSA